jgi:hypothetical protein
MSTPATVPAFLRRWEIKITTGMDSEGNAQTITATSDGFGPNALRATFDIWQPGYQAFWVGDIVIYNFDVQTSKIVLQEGMFVTISAGYENGGQYGLIFAGNIFQSFVVRENVTDFKTVLHCIQGRPQLVKNLINFAMDGPVSQTDFANNAIAASSQQAGKLSLKYLDGLSQKTLPRGKVEFTDPWPFLDQFADDNNQVWFYDMDGKANVTDFNSPSPDAIVYTPQTGLVGTPEQTEQGVAMRFLLDPRLKVKINPVQIQLDETSIIFLKQQIGQQPTVLDQNGVYVIGAVRHFGDTRGNDWYTDVIGYTTVGGKLGLLGSTAALGDAGTNQPVPSQNQGINQK